jgi:hypothetical protein
MSSIIDFQRAGANFDLNSVTYALLKGEIDPISTFTSNIGTLGSWITLYLRDRTLRDDIPSLDNGILDLYHATQQVLEEQEDALTLDLGERTARYLYRHIGYKAQVQLEKLYTGELITYTRMKDVWILELMVGRHLVKLQVPVTSSALPVSFGQRISDIPAQNKFNKHGLYFSNIPSGFLMCSVTVALLQKKVQPQRKFRLSIGQLGSLLTNYRLERKRGPMIPRIDDRIEVLYRATNEALGEQIRPVIYPVERISRELLGKIGYRACVQSEELYTGELLAYRHSNNRWYVKVKVDGDAEVGFREIAAINHSNSIFPIIQFGGRISDSQTESVPVKDHGETNVPDEYKGEDLKDWEVVEEEDAGWVEVA